MSLPPIDEALEQLVERVTEHEVLRTPIRVFLREHCLIFKIDALYGTPRSELERVLSPLALPPGVVYILRTHIFPLAQDRRPTPTPITPTPSRIIPTTTPTPTPTPISPSPTPCPITTPPITPPTIRPITCPTTRRPITPPTTPSPTTTTPTSLVDDWKSCIDSRSGYSFTTLLNSCTRLQIGQNKHSYSLLHCDGCSQSPVTRSQKN